VTLLLVTHAPDLAAQMQRAFRIEDGQLVSSP
jgi:predicted ABC-type transport system involved in lysophospholipase L1 biosynthesis ATPase subunit